MTFTPKKLVVMGSNSFSGQDFVDLALSELPNTQIIGLSRSAEKPDFFLSYKNNPNRKNYRFVQMDFNTQIDDLIKLLDAEKPDAIVNFAAQSEVGPSWQHPEHWFMTNTVSLSRMVNHLRQQNYLQRYVHISSPEAYGTCVGRVLETTPDNPSTPYAASKAAADMILNVYAKEFKFPLLTIRSTNVYGARQQLFKIIPRASIYVKTGKKIQLHGGGVAVKSYIHIRDISRGELAVLQNGRIGERYHLSPDAGVAVKDVVSTICNKLGIDFAAATETVAERPGQDAAYVIDSTKARTELGWRSTVTLDQGIDETVQWVNDNWDAILKEPLDYLHKA